MAEYVSTETPDTISAATYTAGASGGNQPAYFPFVGDPDDLNPPDSIGSSGSNNPSMPGPMTVPGEGGPGSNSPTIG